MDGTPVAVEEGVYVQPRRAGLSATLSIENTKRLTRKIFRVGELYLGFYIEDAIPVLVIVAQPATGNVGIRARTALNLRQFSEDTQIGFLEREERPEGFVTAFIRLVEASPPGPDPSMVMGIRKETLQRHRIQRVRDACEQQRKRYDTCEEVEEAIADLFERRSREKMIAETIFTRAGHVDSPTELPTVETGAEEL
jgi:hypothetical protein